MANCLYQSAKLTRGGHFAKARDELNRAEEILGKLGESSTLGSRLEALQRRVDKVRVQIMFESGEYAAVLDYLNEESEELLPSPDMKTIALVSAYNSLVNPPEPSRATSIELCTLSPLPAWVLFLEVQKILRAQDQPVADSAALSSTACKIAGELIRLGDCQATRDRRVNRSTRLRLDWLPTLLA